MKVTTTITDEKFVKEYIPFLLSIRLKEVLYNSSKDFSSIELYLQENYNLTIDDIVEVFQDNVSISKVGSTYSIVVDRSKFINTQKYITFVELIDKGNLDVQGTNLFTQVFQEIQQKIKSLYSQYMKGGLVYGN